MQRTDDNPFVSFALELSTVSISAFVSAAVSTRARYHRFFMLVAHVLQLTTVAPQSRLVLCTSLHHLKPRTAEHGCVRLVGLHVLRAMLRLATVRVFVWKARHCATVCCHSSSPLTEALSGSSKQDIDACTLRFLSTVTAAIVTRAAVRSSSVGVGAST